MQTFKKFLRWTLPILLGVGTVWLLMFLFSLITWHAVLALAACAATAVGIVYLFIWAYIK